VLKWLREHNCPWDNTRICQQAAKVKSLEMLKWARENGCPWEFERVKAWATLNNDKKMLDWLRERWKEEHQHV